MVSGRTKSTTSSGSTASSKQIAFAARKRRKITALLPSGERYAGYVMGMDDYHWVLCTPSLETVLVHKSSSLLIGFDDEMVSEERSEEIEGRVSAFRQSLEEDYFNNSTRK